MKGQKYRVKLILMIRNFLIIFLASITLLSCAPTPISELGSEEAKLKVMGKYESYLALEYLQFSRYLSATGQVRSAQFFGNKGLKVSKGYVTYPENPLNWDADPQQIENMIFMQQRLETLLKKDRMKHYMPIQMAHLTYLYDCWISRESGTLFISDDLAKCRVRFTRLLDEIERYVDNFDKDKQSKVKIVQPKFKRFEIFFDLNSYKLNSRAKRELLKVVEYIKTLNGEYQILISGNADRSGNVIINQTLALDRANVVKKRLLRNGVVDRAVEVRAFGEGFPDVVTQDGTTESKNRSVRIYITKKYIDISVFPLPLIENIVYHDDILKARKKRGLRND